MALTLAEKIPLKVLAHPERRDGSRSGNLVRLKRSYFNVREIAMPTTEKDKARVNAYVEPKVKELAVAVKRPTESFSMLVEEALLVLVERRQAEAPAHVGASLRAELERRARRSSDKHKLPPGRPLKA